MKIIYFNKYKVIFSQIIHKNIAIPIVSNTCKQLKYITYTIENNNIKINKNYTISFLEQTVPDCNEDADNENADNKDADNYGLASCNPPRCIGDKGKNECNKGGSNHCGDQQGPNCSKLYDIGSSVKDLDNDTCNGDVLRCKLKAPTPKPIPKQCFQYTTEASCTTSKCQWSSGLDGSSEAYITLGTTQGTL